MEPKFWKEELGRLIGYDAHGRVVAVEKKKPGSKSRLTVSIREKGPPSKKRKLYFYALQKFSALLPAIEVVLVEEGFDLNEKYSWEDFKELLFLAETELSLHQLRTAKRVMRYIKKVEEEKR